MERILAAVGRVKKDGPVAGHKADILFHKSIYPKLSYVLREFCNNHSAGGGGLCFSAKIFHKRPDCWCLESIAIQELP